jgi:hypothetical protein
VIAFGLDAAWPGRDGASMKMARRVFGLTSKGRIAPGFDADLVLLRPGERRTGSSGVGARHGLLALGWRELGGGGPSLTMSRGSVVFDGSEGCGPGRAREVRFALAGVACRRSTRPGTGCGFEPARTTKGSPYAVTFEMRPRVGAEGFDTPVELIQRTPQRSRAWTVGSEREADSISVWPADNQVEHAGRSQVNLIRSSNSGIDRIALDDRWEGEWFPLFPLLRNHLGASPSPSSAWPRCPRCTVSRMDNPPPPKLDGSAVQPRLTPVEGLLPPSLGSGPDGVVFAMRTRRPSRAIGRLPTTVGPGE